MKKIFHKNKLILEILIQETIDIDGVLELDLDNQLE